MMVEKDDVRRIERINGKCLRKDENGDGRIESEDEDGGWKIDGMLRKERKKRKWEGGVLKSENELDNSKWIRKGNEGKVGE